MKYTSATLALLAGLAAAHDDPFGGAVPDCAVDCLVTGIEKVGCKVNDPACACTPEKQSELADGEFIACLSSSCSAGEVANAAAGGVAICDGISASGTGTADGGATETGGATSGAGNSTATATSGKAEPTGDEEGDDEDSDGGDDSSDGGDSGSGGGDGGDSGGDDDGGDSGSDDSQEGGDEGGAAVPAIFGGAAILAALLAL